MAGIPRQVRRAVKGKKPRPPLLIRMLSEKSTVKWHENQVKKIEQMQNILDENRGRIIQGRLPHRIGFFEKIIVHTKTPSKKTVPAMGAALAKIFGFTVPTTYLAASQNRTIKTAIISGVVAVISFSVGHILDRKLSEHNQNLRVKDIKKILKHRQLALLQPKKKLKDIQLNAIENYNRKVLQLMESDLEELKRIHEYRINH